MDLDFDDILDDAKPIQKKPQPSYQSYQAKAKPKQEQKRDDSEDSWGEEPEPTVSSKPKQVAEVVKK